MWQIIILGFSFVQSIIGYEITSLIDEKIGTAISPIWDETTQSVLFIDLIGSAADLSIFRYSLEDEQLYKASIEGASEPVGFLAPVQGHPDLYAVGIGHDAYIIRWDGTSTTAQIDHKLFSVDSNDPNSRTDLARPDRQGHLYGGTFAPTFCITTKNKTVFEYSSGEDDINVILDDVYTTSGIAFDESEGILYQMDVCSLVLTAFDWDPESGKLSNSRSAFDFKSIGKSADTFNPLGAETDSDGNVYTADYNTSIYIVDPSEGEVVGTIDMGIQGVSGMAFGGPNMDILFVTVAADIIQLTTGAVLDVIESGSSLYKVTGLGVTGPEPTGFIID